jgi:hypothetical protein
MMASDQRYWEGMIMFWNPEEMATDPMDEGMATS